MEHDPSLSSPDLATGLGGAEIGRCLTRLHHDRFTQSPPTLDSADEVRARALALGLAFEDQVVVPRDGDYSGAIRIDGFGSVAVRHTIEALGAGSPVIVGGRLVSADGKRVGAPDLLLRPGHGYAPIEIKRHRVRLDKGIPAATSELTALADDRRSGVRFRSRRRRDLLQAEHYRRLLAEAGRASDEPLLGVIGNDEPLACTWVDATEGETPISADYDDWILIRAHGHHRPRSGDIRRTPLEPAWFRGECTTCDWYDFCLADLEHRDDVTLLRDVDAGIRSDPGEWRCDHRRRCRRTRSSG